MYPFIAYFILLTLIIMCINYIWRKRKIYYCGYTLNGPFSWPIIGNSLWGIGNSEDILKKLSILFEKYNTPYRFWLGSKLIVAISKPHDLQIMLNSNKCIKKDENLMSLFSAFLGEGLITAQPTIWKSHRKLLNPTFNQKIINSFIPAFNEHTFILIENLKKYSGQQFIDINQYIFLNTLDFICDTAMGVKINSQIKQENYSKALNRLLKITFERIFHIWIHPDQIFYRTNNGKQFLRHLKVIHEFATKVLKRKKNQYYGNKYGIDSDSDILFCNNKKKPLLEYMFELNKNGISFSDKNIFDEINTFMAAVYKGTDTVSSVISFVCMMLGSHQEIQECAYNEIKNILNDTVREISVEDLSKMCLLERIIYETMRLFPPVPLLVRIATEDIQLDSCMIPKDVIIAQINMYTHRDPKLWPNPFKFDPNRFLPEEKLKRHPYSFLPFGGGLRNCIGLRYAMTAMKVTLSLLIKQYCFKSNCDIETLRIENNVVLRPVHGHLIQLELRN